MKKKNKKQNKTKKNKRKTKTNKQTNKRKNACVPVNYSRLTAFRDLLCHLEIWFMDKWNDNVAKRVFACSLCCNDLFQLS